jgi:hypothetical protein
MPCAEKREQLAAGQFAPLAVDLASALRLPASHPQFFDWRSLLAAFNPMRP